MWRDCTGSYSLWGCHFELICCFGDIVHGLSKDGGKDWTSSSCYHANKSRLGRLPSKQLLRREPDARKKGKLAWTLCSFFHVEDDFKFSRQFLRYQLLRLTDQTTIYYRVLQLIPLFIFGCRWKCDEVELDRFSNLDNFLHDFHCVLLVCSINQSTVLAIFINSTNLEQADSNFPMIDWTISSPV